MSFTSPVFLGFILFFLLVYYLLPRRLQWVVLLAASCVFYISGGIRMIAYLLITTLSTYLAGRLLGWLNEKGAGLSQEDKKLLSGRLRTQKRLTVFFAAFLNFGMLYVLKYWDFTAHALGRLIPGSNLPVLNLAIPLGISFYIFQSIGYVVDVYRDKYQPEKNPFKFALFVSFFPQIIQGPISRFDQLAGQLTALREPNFDSIKYGIQLTMWGYFKKLVIAGRAGVLVDHVFNGGTKYDGSVIAFAVLFYCIQLYCDFSGGIDISRGIAGMFGIDMTINFRRPIFAVSLTDYWRRWHISLGTWMKDYVFYPLALSKPFGRLGKFTRKHIGGTVGKIFPTSLATCIIYFIIGIWHGANFRYIAFGFWNGIIITSSLILTGFYSGVRKRLGISDQSRLLRVFRILRTAFLVFIGRYITRAPRLLTALSMLGATFLNFHPERLFDGTLLTLGLDKGAIITVLAGIVAVIYVELLQERGIEIRKSLEKRSFLVQWLAILVPLTAIILLGILNQEYISAEFIYAQF